MSGIFSKFAYYTKLERRRKKDSRGESHRMKCNRCQCKILHLWKKKPKCTSIELKSDLEFKMYEKDLGTTA